MSNVRLNSANKVKLNLSVAPEIRDYLSNEADNFGMSISAYITMLTNQSKQQAQALNAMGNMQELMDQLKSLIAKKED